MNNCEIYFENNKKHNNSFQKQEHLQCSFGLFYCVGMYVFHLSIYSQMKSKPGIKRDCKKIYMIQVKLRLEIKPLSLHHHSIQCSTE